MDNDIKIDGLTFVMTCSAYPEQYDVLQGDEQVGYVRLSAGNLLVYTPDVGGKLFYFTYYRNGTDSFEDDIDRMEYLTTIAEKLNERLA